MTPFTLDTNVHGTEATLHLHGELDVATAPALRDTVVQLISEHRTALVFDCADLALTASCGLGVLIGARARCMGASRAVSLTGVKPALQRLLAVTGIQTLSLTHV